jgi:hypothetical protein
MQIATIRLDFDLGPEEVARANASIVRLPRLAQGTDQDFELSWLLDNAAFDFTPYGAVMTVRASVQDATPVFTLTSAADEIVLALGLVKLLFSAAKTSGLAVPANLQRVGAPQTVRWSHDIRLTQGAHSYPGRRRNFTTSANDADHLAIGGSVPIAVGVISLTKERRPPQSWRDGNPEANGDQNVCWWNKRRTFSRDDHYHI